MNYRGVLFMLGRLLLAMAVALLIPAALSFYLGDGDVRQFLIAAGVTGVAGIALERVFRQG